MIRLFRQIRQKLLENGNLRTYFWYAIGEVFLVVIGILIALQINNWNIERQTRNEEKTYLQNLKRDLQTDIQLLNNNMGTARDNVESTARLISISETGELGNIYNYILDISMTMGSFNFTPTQNTFEEMRSSGKLSIISNESIKQKLLELNEHYVTIEDGEAHVRREYETYLWDEFVNVVSYKSYFDLKYLREVTDFENFEHKIDTAYIESNKAELTNQANEILANKRFQNGLYLYELNYRFIYRLFETAIVDIEALIQLIEEELEI